MRFATDETDVSLDNWHRLCRLLRCRPFQSLAQAATEIDDGRRRASHRARRAARKLLTGAEPWPAINRAAGYRRPTRRGLRLV